MASVRTALPYLFVALLAPAVSAGPVHKAALQGDVATLEKLLDATPALANAREPNGWTPLHWAATRNQERAARLLLDRKADPNAADKAGSTPLHTAAIFGSVGVARTLIQAEAALNSRAANTWTPLHYAIRGGHAELLALLRDSGAKMDIFAAAGLGNAQAVKVLLQMKADRAKSVDGVGLTALHWAASQGHREVAEILLGAGADLHAKTRADWTPLHYAARHGSKDLVEYLLLSGAKPAERDRRGQTPLHLAALYGHADAVAALLAKGADRSLADAQGKTALDLAKEKGHQAVVALLTAPPAE